MAVFIAPNVCRTFTLEFAQPSVARTQLEVPIMLMDTASFHSYAGDVFASSLCMQNGEVH